MKVTPSFSEYCHYAQSYAVVPVTASLLLDEETPVSLFRSLSLEKEPLFLLESVEGRIRFSRYSFIGYDAFGAFEVAQGRCKSPPFLKIKADHPFHALREILRLRSPFLPSLPSFYGGLVGYIGYEAVQYLEKIPLAPLDPLKMPEIFLYLVRSLLIFDHYTHRLIIAVNTLPQGRVREAYREGCSQLKKLVESIGRNKKEVRTLRKGKIGSLSSNFKPQEFKKIVEQARREIIRGECIQVVLSQRFSLFCSYEDLEIYRGLRYINPSPYLFLIRTPYGTLIGSSPELQLRVQRKTITVRPIAGTRRRGKDEQEDMRLEQELRADPKEKAEHLMLVDLGRNDVGRTAALSSVEVKELMTVERYSHVMHLVSEIRGELAPGKKSLDAFEAAFPAGTVTGAPKIRAMEIIAELEKERRGPYAGAAGYFSFTGDSDTAIVLRTIIKQGTKLYIQAGAGIVADSVPEKELEETRNKARGMMAALELVARDFTL